MEWNGRHVNATADEYKDVTVFTGNCRYWYFGDQGSFNVLLKVTALEVSDRGSIPGWDYPVRNRSRPFMGYTQWVLGTFPQDFEDLQTRLQQVSGCRKPTPYNLMGAWS